MENIRKKGRIAIFCVGHPAYWGQFEGLKETLLRYHDILIKKVENFGAEVRDFGMVDDSRLSYDLIPKIAAFSPDVIFCNMTTYATSSVFAPLIRALDVPFVLTALQPLAALDYTKANTRMQLENDSICSVPEFTGVAIRMGKRIADVVIGTLENDEEADEQIKEWCDIAAALRGLSGARIGLMGHVLNTMYDMNADPTAVSAAFGLHVLPLEIDTLVELSKEVTESEIEDKKKAILKQFDTPDPKSDPITRRLTEKDLTASALGAAALDKFIARNELNGLAYYYEGTEGGEVRAMASSLIRGNSMLIGQGFPMCGEFDLKTCVAMLIMDRLGIGGSFAELHPFDFKDNCVLIGHDGPHHIAIAEGKPVVRSLIKYHGKPGSGASVEFKLREGPITMLGITQTENGKMKFVIGEGESQKGSIPPTGNTNTRAVFLPSTKDFVRRWVMEGPTHHYALGIGHKADTIKKIADVLHIESVIVR